MTDAARNLRAHFLKLASFESVFLRFFEKFF